MKFDSCFDSFLIDPWSEEWYYMMHFWFNEVNLMILMINYGVISLFVKIWTCWRFFSLNVWKETSTQYYLWAELLSLIDLLWSLTDLLWSLMITYVGWFPNKNFRYRDFVAFIFCNDHEWSWMIMNDHVGQHSLNTIRPQHSHFKDESSPKVTTCLILYYLVSLCRWEEALMGGMQGCSGKHPKSSGASKHSKGRWQRVPALE